MSTSGRRNDEQVASDILGARSDHEILGLSSTDVVTRQVIRKLYYARCIQVHPDKNSSKNATAAFKILSAAYDRLVATTSDGTDQQNVSTERSSQAKPRPPGATEGDMKWRRHGAGVGVTGEKRDCRKWWEECTFSELEQQLRQEEVIFQRELIRARKRSAERASARALKRKQNALRIAQGLATLQAKYSLGTPSSASKSAKNSAKTHSEVPPSKRFKTTKSHTRLDGTEGAGVEVPSHEPLQPSSFSRGKMYSESVDTRRSDRSSQIGSGRWGHDGWDEVNGGTQLENTGSRKPVDYSSYFASSMTTGKPNDMG